MNNSPTNPGSHWLGVIGISAVFVLLGLMAGMVRNNGGTAASFALPTGPTNSSVTAPSVSPSPTFPTTMEPTEIYPPTEDWGATETVSAILDSTKAVLRVTADYMLTHPPPTVTPITGISYTEMVFPQYRLENAWSDFINGEWTGVVAGAYSENLAQGILVFVWMEEIYETPLQAGSVHIVEEQNYRLTLLSTDGTIFYFDIPGRRFVESLSEVVPTITPITPSPTSPSPTPTITPTFDPTWLTPWPTCTPIPPSMATSGPCIP